MPADQRVDLGGDIVPNKLSGTSPFCAQFTIIASPDSGPDRVTKALVEFGDGTEKEFPVLGGKCVVTHRFIYEKGPGQYFTKHFSPRITLFTDTGYSEVLPDNCIVIEVHDAKEQAE